MAEDSFARTGLSPSYAFVLIIVHRSPGLGPSQIARKMHMQPSTITRFLDKLERQGFLSREEDGKTVKVHPTDQSQELYETLLECWEDLTERYQEELGLNMSKLLSNNISAAIDRLSTS